MNAKPIRTQTQFRDSVTGQFTTARIATQRPRETERERIKYPTPASLRKNK
jgi:hypothetical protein